MKKAITRISVVLLIMAMLCPTVLAAEVSTAQPRYTYTYEINAVLDISNGVAFGAASMVVHDNYSAKLICRLQQLKNGNWVTLKSWSAKDIDYVYASQEWAVASGYQYRLVVLGYTYDDNGNVIETVTCNDYFDYS